MNKLKYIFINILIAKREEINFETSKILINLSRYQNIKPDNLKIIIIENC